MRIGGLSSGMDIDQIVGDLMKASRLPLNKLHKKKQTLEWKRDDYRSMNSKLAELDKFIFDGVFRQSTFTKKTVTSSKESEVSVKNINATSNSSATINVNSLAQAAYMSSSGSIKSADPVKTFDPNGKLADQMANLDVNTDFTVNNNHKFTIQSINKDGTLGTAVEFTIDPATDSLNSLISRINDSTAGVVAFFDSQTGKMSITAKNTGDAKNPDSSDAPEIVLTGDFLKNTLKLDSDSNAAANPVAPQVSRGRAGSDASFIINGLQTKRSTNTFQINGFEYTLKSASNTDINIASSTDTDSIYNSVKAFVDKYNETLDTINKKTTEEKYNSYKPLTDEEKEGMSEKQIELWEEKAKSGMLKNDSILSSAMNKIRADVSARVGTDTDDINNNYDQLAEIGITTSSNYRDKGKLMINETKLREAISNDPNAIYKLFNNDTTDYNTQGLGNRLRTTIKNTINEIEDRAGNSLRTRSQFTLGRNLITVDKQIDSFEDKLSKMESRYWKQFTAMEKAIQKSNSQSTYISQQFA